MTSDVKDTERDLSAVWLTDFLFFGLKGYFSFKGRDAYCTPANSDDDATGDD